LCVSRKWERHVNHYLKGKKKKKKGMSLKGCTEKGHPNLL